MLRDLHAGALSHPWRMTWLLGINLSGAAAAGNYCNAATAVSLIGLFVSLRRVQGNDNCREVSRTGSQLESDKMKYDD